MIHAVFAIAFIGMLWSFIDERVAKMWFNSRDYLAIPGLPTQGDFPTYRKAFRRVSLIILVCIVIIYILGLIAEIIPK